MTEQTTTPSTTPSVHLAWSAVMADVRELAKGERNNTPGASFNFRGIDAVMNAAGPALRRHGVAVVPNVTSANYRDVQTSTGKPSREATVLVSFTVYGPAGDSFTGAAPGESMDSGDKGTAKAMSVAMRTFLLQALCLPTQDSDPDAETYERAGAPTSGETAQKVADGLPGCAAAEKLASVRAWSDERGLLDLMVSDEQGNGLPLRQLLDRHDERLGAGQEAGR